MHGARKLTRAAASTTGQVRTMWSPHPLQGCEQYTQRNSARSGAWVEGAMRTQANQRPSVGTLPSASSQAQECRA